LSASHGGVVDPSRALWPPSPIATLLRMTDVLEPGSLVEGYRIAAVVGQGGMGTVYRAVHLASGATVALKLMLPASAADPIQVRRFRREARASMAVQHPSIVRILEVFQHEGRPALAMEYLEGTTLTDLLAQRARLPHAELALLMLPVTSAVGTAHALGIVHRDLKPDNILLQQGPGGVIVRVLDFGIAKLTATEGPVRESIALTTQGMLVGTPFYMSPEQAFGEQSIDHRSDIWSLGILFYLSLTGVLPTFGRSLGEVFRKVVATPIRPITELCPSLPWDFATLVMRMLQRNRDDRPVDLREVHALLQQHAGMAAPSFEPARAPIADEVTVDGGR
jgi:serine/threonine-protein kinase